jgi:hypothetical protein
MKFKVNASHGFMYGVKAFKIPAFWFDKLLPENWEL